MTRGTGSSGYVINAGGRNWLFSFRARSHDIYGFEGESTNLDPAGLSHGEVSTELKARFAVWAYTIVTSAHAKPDTKESEAALRQADLTGRTLAVMLRWEIGPGPEIIYVDQFRNPCGGTRAWQVTAAGKLRPYIHRPSAGFIIDAEDEAGMGEWAWEYCPAAARMRGAPAALGNWIAEVAIPHDLLLRFRDWSRKVWQTVHYSGQSMHDLNWPSFNAEGLELSHHLKQVVGRDYCVIYARSYDEPHERRPWDAVEIRVDGTERPYRHRPYWARADSSTADATGHESCH